MLLLLVQAAGTTRRVVGIGFVAACLLTLTPPAQSLELELPLVLPASSHGPQGFVRIINYSYQAGTVRIHAIDDTGRRFGPASLSLEAGGAIQFNSRDLERGSSRIGLSLGIGEGTGNWRLRMDTDLDIEALAYIRTPDGFLTSMHEVASEVLPMLYHLPIFNPGSNRSLVSRLRLVNSHGGDAEVSIGAWDARGNRPPGGPVRLTLPPWSARTLTAQQLEAGDSELSGRFGDGEGKWELVVSSSVPIQVMSLMQTRSGHLTNLSTSSDAADDYFNFFRVFN